MTKIEELKKIANSHWFVTRTRLSTCHFEQHKEKRLWVWVGDSKNPILIKEDWIPDNNLKEYFQEWLLLL